MKTIIAGSRHYKEYQYVVDAIKSSGFDITTVVCGEATGADALGREWAEANNIPIDSFPANWSDIGHKDAYIKTRRDGKKYDVKAGLRRNIEMSKHADALIALWDGGSRGTKHMINQAKKMGLQIFVYNPKNPQLTLF